MRCIRAVKSLRAQEGSRISAVALYTEVDRDAPFVRHADLAVELPVTGSEVAAYLDHDLLIETLHRVEADAVWPGWGFVAEDPVFVERLATEGICFLGPSADALRVLGDKIAAKRLAESAKVPVMPWSGAAVADSEEARIAAEAIGYPVVIKARAGAGGRGIRVVDEPGALCRGLSVGSGGGGGLLRRRTPVRGETDRIRASRRGADRRRPVGRRARARLPGMLGPAPSPEADRGGAASRPLRGAARVVAGSRGSHRRDGGLPGVGDRRVPGDRERVLLPRDESAPPGGARRHRGDHRERPGRGSRSRSRAESRSPTLRCVRRASPSRRACAPRIPTSASRRRRAASFASTRRSAPGSASTPAWPPEAWCPRPSIP